VRRHRSRGAVGVPVDDRLVHLGVHQMRALFEPTPNGADRHEHPGARVLDGSGQTLVSSDPRDQEVIRAVDSNPFGHRPLADDNRLEAGERTLQVRNVGFRAPLCGKPSGHGLDRKPEVDDLLELPQVLAQVGRPRRPRTHDDAAGRAAPDLDETLAFEHPHGLAHGGAGDAELLRKFPLGWQLVAWPEMTEVDRSSQLLEDELVRSDGGDRA